MPKAIFTFLILFVLIYPKFPLAAISGTFVAIRLEDIVILLTLIYLNFKLIKNTPIHRSVYLYLFIAACAAFSGIFLTKTANLGQGLLHLFRRFEYMSMFFVGFYLFNKKIHFQFLLNLLIFATTIISLYGLGQQYLQFPIISTTNSEFSKGLALTLGAGARINSTFAGHYDLAAFMLFPLILIISLIIQNPKYKIPLIILWIISYWVMLLSASRITFASLFIATILFLIFVKKYKLIPLFVIITVFGFLASPQLRGRYLELIKNHLSIPKVSAQEVVRPVFDTADALKPPAVPEDRSLNIRLKAEWPKALRAFYKNPVFGSGFSSIGLASDNEYLRLLAESGILGFFSFILIFYRYIKLIIKSKDYFLLATACAIIGLLLNAMFIDVFTASKIALFTWLLIGITTKIAISYEK